MKKTLLFIIILLCIIEVKSQTLGTCGTQNIEIDEPKNFSCASNGTDFNSKYKTLDFWIPDGSTPIKTIRVNIVVTQSTDPTKQLWTDTPFFRESVNTMFDKVNEIYSNSVPNNYPIACPPNSINYINDTKIRFQLNEIIFLPPNDVFYYSGYDTADKTDQIATFLNQNYPSCKTSLNHIFSMPPPYAGHPWGQWRPRGGLAIVNTWFSMWGNSMYWHNHASHFVHEYGHALGLHHTYDGPEPGLDITDFDFLDDVFGTCPEPAMLDANNTCYSTCNNLSIPASQRKCPPPVPASNRIVPITKECFYYNYSGVGYPLMSGGFYDENDPFIRYYISPKSAARMHRSLSLYENSFVMISNNAVMAKCARGPHPSTSTPHNVSTNETWDFAIKMYQNIRVGGTLTIKCKVSMPLNGYIEVMPGGKLIIDGGIVTNEYGQSWGGVIINGDPSKPMVMGGNADHGYVELKNGAKIENALVGIDAQYGECVEFICNTCRFDKKEVSDWTIEGPSKINRHSVISQNHYETVDLRKLSLDIKRQLQFQGGKTLTEKATNYAPEEQKKEDYMQHKKDIFNNNLLS